MPKHVNSFTVLDVNECLTTPCDANAVCTNTLGSFTCVCNPGYSGDGLTCNGSYSHIITADVLLPFLFWEKACNLSKPSVQRYSQEAVMLLSVDLNLLFAILFCARPALL